MRLRKALRKIHRWVGLLSALWLLQLTATGLLLQQADNLGLSDTFVESPTVLQWFDYGKRQTAWDLKETTVYQVDDVISVSGKQHQFSDQLIGAVQSSEHLVLASADSLLWFNLSGDLIQSLDDFDGLPTPVTAIHAVEGVSIRIEDRWFKVDISGQIESSTALTVGQANMARVLTAAERKQLLPQILNSKLSYDKVLLGIHSGVKSSVWLNSLSALALLFLCFSGIYLFFKQPKSRKLS